MFRRRTSLSLSAAVAVLVAAPLLTACGSEAHPGAAAVVGGERITMGQVQSQVRAVRAAQNESDRSAELIRNTEQLTRGTVSSLVFERVLERAAEDAGVTVNRGEIQRAREEAERNVGGPEELEAMMLQQRAVAPDEIDRAVRSQLLVQKLAEKLGANLQTPQGQQEITQALAEASEELDVTVNPRFGAWDDKQITLADTKEPWIRNVSNPDPQQPA
ncbi:SurA N-terminal domain-containing protein [Streptomyces radiopugnans]|uniref:SurA N-terminal domain-containing protein n=1 Tax=Streptomyces radiopugnans TaxID=403935 RepID=A0A1H9H4L7_9ACTN|nr:SurA N-terminal domain-containing protein [Streptomyces radiopugnans]SEQ57285.1 SurA N-terminal domain-containing protein [Streptomyces radiopugnans]